MIPTLYLEGPSLSDFNSYLETEKYIDLYYKEEEKGSHRIFKDNVNDFKKFNDYKHNLEKINQ